VWSRSSGTQIFASVYLSAANGNRVSEAVIKINCKPALRLKHIGVYSTRMNQTRQGGIYCNHLDATIGHPIIEHFIPGLGVVTEIYTGFSAS
jgi:hypothetical protein